MYIYNYSYAPWCPACQNIAETWVNFATWAKRQKDFTVNVAEVDVTEDEGELIPCGTLFDTFVFSIGIPVARVITHFISISVQYV